VISDGVLDGNALVMIGSTSGDVDDRGAGGMGGIAGPVTAAEEAVLRPELNLRSNISQDVVRALESNLRTMDL
jgi:hypothetical protein